MAEFFAGVALAFVISWWVSVEAGDGKILDWMEESTMRQPMNGTDLEITIFGCGPTDTEENIRGAVRRAMRRDNEKV